MKGSDKKYINLEFWNPIFQKMGLLLDRISDFKGPEMSIDDTEYRWVNDRIEYFNCEERILTQEEMRKMTDNTFQNPNSGVSAPSWKPEEVKKEKDKLKINTNSTAPVVNTVVTPRASKALGVPKK